MKVGKFWAQVKREWAEKGKLLQRLRTCSMMSGVMEGAYGVRGGMMSFWGCL